MTHKWQDSDSDHSFTVEPPVSFTNLSFAMLDLLLLGCCGSACEHWLILEIIIRDRFALHFIWLETDEGDKSVKNYTVNGLWCCILSSHYEKIECSKSIQMKLAVLNRLNHVENLTVLSAATRFLFTTSGESTSLQIFDWQRKHTLHFTHTHMQSVLITCVCVCYVILTYVVVTCFANTFSGAITAS